MNKSKTFTILFQIVLYNSSFLESAKDFSSMQQKTSSEYFNNTKSTSYNSDLSFKENNVALDTKNQDAIKSKKFNRSLFQFFTEESLLLSRTLKNNN